MSEPRPASPFAVGFASLLGIGVLIRVWGLLVRGALDGDEAALGLNILGRAWPEVARPFVYQQYAPYLYLQLSKLALTLFGAHDSVLRGASLLCGCLLLPAVLVFVRTISGWAAALFALALVVPNPTWLQAAIEFLPHASDALITCGLCLLTLRVLNEDERSRHSLGLLSVAGVLAPWFSLPAIITLAGCACAVAADQSTGEDRKLSLHPLLLAALWSISFAAHSFAFPAPLGAADSLSFSAALQHVPRQFLDTFALLLTPGGGDALCALAIVLWGAGLFLLWRAQPALCVLLVAPWLAWIVAAISSSTWAHYGSMFYSLPLIMTPVVTALVALSQLSGLTSQLMAAGIAVLMCAAPSRQLAHMLSTPPASASVVQLVGYLRSQRQASDKLYVEKRAQPVYAFYARRAHVDAPFPVADDRLDEVTPSYETLDSLSGAARVWVVLRAPETELETLVTARLDSHGHAVDMLDGGNCRLYLYDLSR
jgi:hypothetical protein